MKRASKPSGSAGEANAGDAGAAEHAAAPALPGAGRREAGRGHAGTAAVMLALVAGVGCDSPKAEPAAPPPSAAAATVPASPPPEIQAPEIIVDRASVSVGRNRLAANEPNLADRVAVFLRGAPKIEGQTADVVILRNAKPSQAVGVLAALRQSKAVGANVKSETRDGATKALPVAFLSRLPDCATVAWIAKDASLDVWPAGGGRAKRAPRGLAGPDLTLGMDAFRALAESCEASQFAVGADEAMTWGLVFDVAMEALHQSWTRTSAAVVVADATPGRKLVL
jgi:hypothetical protein